LNALAGTVEGEGLILGRGLVGDRVRPASAHRWCSATVQREHVAHRRRPASSVVQHDLQRAPRRALRGVPLNSRSSHRTSAIDGSALPSASVAVQVSVSPASTSAKVEAGTLKLNSSSSVACLVGDRRWPASAHRWC
jgi:hypothetical protein